MASLLAGTSAELEAIRGRLATAASGGADAGTLWGEMFGAVDVIGRAMQATHMFMENVERKQVERDQLIGLHGSSITALQSGTTTLNASMVTMQSVVA